MICLASLWASCANAQWGPRTPNDTLNSTRILSGSSVAFQIYAPKAETVSLGGDIRGHGVEFTRNGSGVWTAVMEGIEALEVFLNDYNKFDYFWVLSSGWWKDDRTYPVYQKRLDAIAGGVAKSVRQLVLTQGGPEDIAYGNCKAMLELFDKAGIRYEFTEAPGGHTWHTWRRDLYNMAPRLFK